MTTVRDIVGDALIEIGIQDPSESVSADKGSYGLRVLNRMVQKWNIDELMVYTVNRDTFNLTAGKQTYSLGTGGDFNMARPARVSMVSVLLSSGTEVPIQSLTDEEWRAISVKGTTTASFPTSVWIKGDMPLNNLSFWPVPGDSTVQVVLYSWNLTSDFASLNDSIVLPPGYEEALVTNLALALSGAYGVAPSPTLQTRAAQARAKIESLNVDPLCASFDFGVKGGNIAIRSFGMVVDP